jgi:hypothetical protein
MVSFKLACNIIASQKLIHIKQGKTGKKNWEKQIYRSSFLYPFT